MSAEQESDNHCVISVRILLFSRTFCQSVPQKNATTKIHKIQIQEIFLQLGSFGFKIHLRICPKKLKMIIRIRNPADLDFPPKTHPYCILIPFGLQNFYCVWYMNFPWVFLYLFIIFFICLQFIDYVDFFADDSKGLILSSSQDQSIRLSEVKPSSFHLSSFFSRFRYTL